MGRDSLLLLPLLSLLPLLLLLLVLLRTLTCCHDVVMLVYTEDGMENGDGQDAGQGRGTLRQAMTTIATATTMMMVYSIMFR